MKETRNKYSSLTEKALGKYSFKTSGKRLENITLNRKGYYEYNAKRGSGWN
jgi:hypothetical protein